MFNPQLKQGLSNRAASGRDSVPLPDEDGPAFIVTCAAIHYQTDKIPQKLDLKFLKNLATVCDKYKCVSALAPWSAIWLDKTTEGLNEDDLKRSMCAAYLSNSPEAFPKISLRMLYVQVGPFVY